jgi:SAM-dependent methyltransferase
MNQEHMELLRSEGWRDLLEQLILPFALGTLTWTDLGDDVLEVGPGPGTTTALLRTRLPRLTAIELDPELADTLRGQARDGGLTVDQGDATSMPYDDGRFSAVVMFTMCHHVPTAALQDQLFAEARRVLRPGGVLIANDSVPSAELEALHDGDVYCPIDPAGLEARLEAVGFDSIQVRWNDFGWAAHAFLESGRSPRSGS